MTATRLRQVGKKDRFHRKQPCLRNMTYGLDPSEVRVIELDASTRASPLTARLSIALA